MTKSLEEIYEYVLDYRNAGIKTYNEESQKLYHRGNDIDVRLGSDLIVLASALVAVAGGLLISQATNENNFLKIISIASIFALFISIGGGLWYYSDVQKYWKKWGNVKHEQAGLFSENKSKTLEELEVVLKKVVKKGKEAPKQSRTLFRKIQVSTFVAGVCLLICSIISFSFFNQASVNTYHHSSNLAQPFSKNRKHKF